MENTIEKVEETVVKKRGRKPGSKNARRIGDDIEKEKKATVRKPYKTRTYKDLVVKKSTKIEKKASYTSKDTIYSDKATPETKRSSKTVVHSIGGVPISFRNVPDVNINDVLYIIRTSGSMKDIPIIGLVKDVVKNARKEQLAITIQEIEALPEGDGYNTIILKL